MRRLGAVLASAVLLAAMAVTAVRSPAEPATQAAAVAPLGDGSLTRGLQGVVDLHTAHQAELTKFYDGVHKAELARQEAVREAARKAEAARRAQSERAQSERASRSRPRTSTPTARPAAGSCDTSSWQACVASLPWSVSTAMAIVRCESGGNPNARNSHSSATGLFQILGGPIDPIANTLQAYSMYRSRGWQPWNASRSCWA